MAGGQILAFPIDFDRRPYNTLALPCECVMCFVYLLAKQRSAFNGKHVIFGIVFPQVVQKH